MQQHKVSDLEIRSLIDSANRLIYRRRAQGLFTMSFLMRSATSCCAVLIRAPFLSAQDGVTLYKQHCSACHDQISPRIPPRSVLQKLSASRILRTPDFGVMMSIAYTPRRQEREAIANFLGTPGQDAPFRASAFCSERGQSL